MNLRRGIFAFIVVAMLAGMLIIPILKISEIHADVPVQETEVVKNNVWDIWKKEWKTIKNDRTQISLSPGSDASKLNFAWYSKRGSLPRLKIGTKKDMSDAKIYIPSQTEIENSNADDLLYMSNKLTVSGLKENTTYYYTYQIDGIYKEPVEYRTQSGADFCFIYVGDPQIGASNEKRASQKNSKEEWNTFFQAQSEAVCADSFQWNDTLNQAMKKTSGKASFILSAGDQIQLMKRKSPDQDFTANEIEYTGFLRPDVLKSVPLATTVGNHDADNENYLHHFNPANLSELGSNGIVGGDYYFTYGNVLFLMLNTQETRTSEHKEFIEKTIAENPEAKWRIATFHQDLYGAAVHSVTPEVIHLREALVPILEAADIDVVLNGHDHAYSRSFLLRDGKKDQEGILYLTAGSSSGSKYYDLISNPVDYIAKKWQEKVPTYSVIDMTKDTFTIRTYRTDTNQLIDDVFMIQKTVKS